MSNKKHKEEEMQANADATGATLSELDALKSKLVEVETKSGEHLDLLMRERADFSNFKKRTEAERALSYQIAKAEAIKRLLPVLDDLERAMSNRPTDETSQAWVSGVELVLRKFQNILESEGIKRIDAEGQPFDPNFHEAISQEPSDSHESGVVIAVVQQGYMMGDRILRHALVKIAA
jgi:molecular chaperone GrpE